MESAREARRRKILERGSDRLAFITGQARSLPPSSITTPPPEEEGEEVFRSTVAPPGEDNLTSHELPKCEADSETVGYNLDTGDCVEPVLPKFEKTNEAASKAQHSSGNAEPSAVQSSFDHTVNTAPPRVAKTTIHQIFTAKKFSSSISATENIRLLFAASIALLVVLSYRGFPLGGNVLKSIISFRPIYLVLLTDATLMLGVLMATTQGHEDAERTGEGESNWADQMGKAVEAAMVLQKAMSAAFLDCCVCAVIMISGIPFGGMKDLF